MQNEKYRSATRYKNRIKTDAVSLMTLGVDLCGITVAKVRSLRFLGECAKAVKLCRFNQKEPWMSVVDLPMDVQKNLIFNLINIKK